MVMSLLRLSPLGGRTPFSPSFFDLGDLDLEFLDKGAGSCMMVLFDLAVVPKLSSGSGEGAKV